MYIYVYEKWYKVRKLQIVLSVLPVLCVVIARMIHESPRTQPQLFTIFVMEDGKVIFTNNDEILFVLVIEMGY